MEENFVIDTGNKEFQDALSLIQYTSQSVFLTGKAGTGKSTFLKYVCEHTKKKYVVLAPTGLMWVVVRFILSLRCRFGPCCPTIPI